MCVTQWRSEKKSTGCLLCLFGQRLVDLVIKRTWASRAAGQSLILFFPLRLLPRPSQTYQPPPPSSPPKKKTTKTPQTKTKQNKTKKQTKEQTKIGFKGAIRDFFFFFFLQSAHCAANRLQHVRSCGPGTVVCKITCNTSSAYHVQHVVLRATRYQGTAQLLSLTELKSHLFEL